PPPATRPEETGSPCHHFREPQRFQSAPGHSAGGNAGTIAMTQSPCEVSIRPRPLGRRKPGSGPSTRSRAHGFNPPPATRPEETLVLFSFSADCFLFQSAPGHSAGGNAAFRAATAAA